MVETRDQFLNFLKIVYTQRFKNTHFSGINIRLRSITTNSPLVITVN